MVTDMNIHPPDIVYLFKFGVDGSTKWDAGQVFLPCNKHHTYKLSTKKGLEDKSIKVNYSSIKSKYSLVISLDVISFWYMHYTLEANTLSRSGIIRIYIEQQRGRQRIYNIYMCNYLYDCNYAVNTNNVNCSQPIVILMKYTEIRAMISI